MTRRRDSIGGNDPLTISAASSDGVIAFRLAARPGGLNVQRTQRRGGGQRIVQSIRFADEASFVRWCDADELHFTYPLLFVNLKRSGCELFGRSA